MVLAVLKAEPVVDENLISPSSVPSPPLFDTDPPVGITTDALPVKVPRFLVTVTVMALPVLVTGLPPASVSISFDVKVVPEPPHPV